LNNYGSGEGVVMQDKKNIQYGSGNHGETWVKMEKNG